MTCSESFRANGDATAMRALCRTCKVRYRSPILQAAITLSRLLCILFDQIWHSFATINKSTDARSGRHMPNTRTCSFHVVAMLFNKTHVTREIAMWRGGEAVNQGSTVPA